MNLTIGTRVFNNGDRCNPEHFGTITAVKSDKWGTRYEFTPDDLSLTAHDAPYWVESCQFSEKFLGHGGTRFVTEEAYKAYRAEKIAEFKAWADRTTKA